MKEYLLSYEKQNTLSFARNAWEAKRIASVKFGCSPKEVIAMPLDIKIK